MRGEPFRHNGMRFWKKRAPWRYCGLQHTWRCRCLPLCLLYYRNTSLQAEAVGGIVGYNNKAYIYGRYSTHVGFNGSVIGDESGIGSIAGYTSRHVTSCHIVQPDEMTGIKPICKSIYTPDLNTSDNSVWKVQSIWNLTASNLPMIEADYTGEQSN